MAAAWDLDSEAVSFTQYLCERPLRGWFAVHQKNRFELARDRFDPLDQALLVGMPAQLVHLDHFRTQLVRLAEDGNLRLLLDNLAAERFQAFDTYNQNQASVGF